MARYHTHIHTQNQKAKKNKKKTPSKEGRIISVYSLRIRQSSLEEKKWQQENEAVFSNCVHSLGVEEEEWSRRVPFVLLIHSGTQAHGTEPPIFPVFPPRQFFLDTPSQTHTECVSLVILNLAKLTIMINHHSWEWVIHAPHTVMSNKGF